MRAQVFAGSLALAAALVVTGVAELSRPAAFVVAGALLGLWSWLVLAEVGG